MIEKNLYYYYMHPEKYKRLTRNELNTNTCVDLCEIILKGMRIEMDACIRMRNIYPGSKEYKEKANDMLEDLETDYFDSITFGHGSDIAETFAKQCRLRGD